jgi:hypothetical protein
MAKRTTKRDVILEGIDKEIASVKADIATAEAEMAVHRSNLSSLYAVGHALEKLRRQTAESLTPQSCQLATKPNGGIAGTTKDSPSRDKGQCAHEYPDNRFCGQPNTDPIHAEDNDDVLAHAFIASGARRKSSPKKHARLPASSSEDLMDRRPAPDEMCAYISDDGRGNGAECRSVQADPIHDKSMGYGGYHPFKPLSAARNAQPPSSANGVGSSSILNSVDETVSVGVAAGGSSD